MCENGDMISIWTSGGDYKCEKFILPTHTQSELASLFVIHVVMNVTCAQLAILLNTTQFTQ